MNRERIEQLEADYLAEHPDRAETVEPFVFDAKTLAELKSGLFGFPFPAITDVLLADDWEETEQTWFVDSSGFGSPNEPALTADAFRVELLAYLIEHPDHGFGLSGVGQFQVYVSAYRRL